MRVADFLDQPPESRETWSTGLSSLDELVGGFARGQLWVITGAPTSGKSMLLSQLVFTLAVEHQFKTDYYCSRVDHPDLTRARLVSLAVRRAPVLPHLVVPLGDLRARQRERLDSLAAAQLAIFTGGSLTIPEWADARKAQRCLAIDDPEFKRAPVLDQGARHKLRAVADSGAVVLVTIPRSLCIESSESGERLREEWSAVADLVIETVPGFAGDAVLSIKQNRRGPCLDIGVLAISHYSRFLDPASS
jgi:hypothetical protein